MLELRQIKKDYPAGAGTVHALKGVDLTFRNCEFVSILGPSGCGKTTLLNIIGGLDQYTSGELLINGVSTKKYGDRDWDSYRNHSVGFVFQTYNLIPHQTVLQNVEIALTLSGVSKGERKERAIKALQDVGLGDQLYKKPNAMSGGQMQRVAIARALVNNPDIILADEPTGALDTETSVQVMEILKEVAKDRLVVMVTHNPELAEKYSTRIIRMLDGNVLGDSMPITEEEYQTTKAADKIKIEKAGKEKKPSMSFWTSFKLSLKNLFTKKGRTTLTSFAGSIGIIGIALILAVSQGTTGYINYVQETTLASYPLTLEATTVDLTSLMQSFMKSGDDKIDHDQDAIYKNPMIAELVNALASVEASENDLKTFKEYLEAELKKDGSDLQKSVSGVQYSYGLDLPVYTRNVDGNIVKSDTRTLMTEMIGDYMMQVAAGGGSSTDEGNSSTTSPQGSMFSTMITGGSMWKELLPGLEDGALINDIIYEQYELIDGGSWPNEYDEIVLIVNENNELDDLTLYALGLLSKTEIDAIIDAAANGEEVEDSGNNRWTYDEIKSRTFKAVLPADCYQKVGDIYVDVSGVDLYLEALYQKAIDLKVTGIVRCKEDVDSAMLSSGIGYTSALTKYVIEQSVNSEVAQVQLANPTVDVLTGLPFQSNTGNMSDEQKATAFAAYIAELSTEEKAEAYVKIQCVNADAAELKLSTEAILAQFNDKDALVGQISAALAAQMGGSAEQFAGFFENSTIDELKAMLRPTIEEQVRASIHQRVETELSALTAEEKAAALDAAWDGYATETLALYYDEITVFSNSSYEENMANFGVLDLASPAAINIYSSSFENKDVIVAAIDKYNKSVDEAQKITYTDYMGILMSSITTIINAITYVLIAFVAVSLVVSSIMIGVITLISVQERTKEIGILRAIGASKRDVSGMFNAETLIIGFAAGLLGVLVTYLLCIPINLILHALTGLPQLNATLPIGAAIILILISMALTLIAGLIPSRSAAKKDPVVALRTE